ncbi:hypothetical protein PC118_g14007 [Phytophthora cactorum]|uniref:ABC transmembrane type-1 domain-containing protein n=2 Tax=Phytophthora cactorum TaxID=29920 RepID=A0A8T1FV59_9STRA|nr:hypothetical protein PC118_g14007 [Phytophthora cactorum]
MSKLSADDNYLPAKTSTAAESWSREGSFEEDKGDLHDKENPLNTARFLSIATMWWMHPLLKRGYKTPLDENSVWDLPTDDQARPLQVKFDQSYALESQKVAGKTKRNGAPKRPNVNRAIWESVKQTWGIAFVLHVVSAGLILFQPFLIKAILQNINGEDNSLGISSGYTLAVLLGCTAFVGATTMSAGQFLTTRIACNARMICINSAFRKILRLSAIARRTMDTGEIVTFVGVDSDRVLSAYKLGMWCTISPLMLLVVGVLIGTQMHVIVALVASVAIAIILYASLFMSKMIGAYRRQISRISANRLKVTNEMLQGIRVVKFYRWEGFATDLIGEIRAREIALLRKYNYVRLANTVLTFLAPTLLSLVCFATTVLLGNTLDIPTTFAIVALTNACRTPFSVYADASVAVAEAITSTSRLSDFLAAGETTDNIQQSEDLTLEIPPQISIENADFKWEEDASAPTLANINVSLQPGTLTVVVGPVGGQIDGDGTLMELQDKFSFLRCSPRSRRSSVEDPAKYEVPGAVEDDEKSTQAKLIVANNDAVKASSSGKLTTLEDRLVGSVKLQSYTDYLACSEWDARVLCGLMIALFTIAQVVLFGCDWFLSLWSQGSVDLSQLNSLAVYVGIVVAAAILSLGRCIFFMTICMVCSLKIHFKHLKKVMAAPITTFFDITPIGRILNRFSRDLDEVDNPLPYWGLWLALCIFQVASSFIVCAVVNPFVLIVYVPVGYGCWFAAKVYRASARELKRLDGVSRSPFLNLMSETISGIETVRSYKMVDAFASRCEELLNKNIRVFFLAQVSSRWFDMRSDWLVSVIIGAVAILAVAAKSTVGASVAGLGLTYAAQLSSNFQRMTTLATKVESSMTCFERIAHYGSLDEEGFKRTPSNKDALSPAWPKTGNVVFENVSMREERRRVVGGST